MRLRGGVENVNISYQGFDPGNFGSMTTASDGTASASLDAGDYNWSATFPSGYEILIPFATFGTKTIVDGQQVDIILLLIQSDPPPGGGGGLNPGPHELINFAWSWDVLPTPSFSGVGTQTNDEQDSASLSVTATDPNGLSLTYAAINLPPGLTINSATGLITGTIDYAAAGRPAHEFSVSVLAVNSAGQSDSTSFDWLVENVNRPPVVTPVPAQTTQAGASVDLLLGSTDPDDDRVYLSLDGLPNGLEYDSETGRITGTVRSDEEGGARTVTIQATDLIDEATQTISWTINANPHPTIQTISPQIATEGDTVSLQVSASDTSEAPLVFSANDLPDGLSIDAQTGLITGTIALDAAGAGPYLVNVFADNGMATDLTSFEWTVNPFVTMAVLPDPTNMEGDSISLQVIGSSPNGPLTFDAIDLPDGLEINPATGLISGNMATTTSRHSPYLIRVTATDGTYSTFREAEWTVGRLTNAAPALPVPPSTTATAGEYLMLDLGATDADEDDIDYAATGLPAGLLIDETTGLITGTPADSEIPTGSFEVTVTADDGHGGEATRAFSLAVADGSFSVQPVPLEPPMPVPSVVAGREDWIEVATLVDTVPGRSPASYVATIDWGDGTSEDGGYFEIDEFDSDILHIFGRHIYERSGDYEVNVEVVNPAGSIQSTATPTVLEVVPEPVVFLSGDLTIQAPVGESFTRTVAVFDTANPFLTTDDITASISWGNGQTTVGTVVEVDDGFVILASNSFSLSSSYSVSVTVIADGVAAYCGAQVRVGHTYAARVSHLTAGSFTTTEPVSSLTATIEWETGVSSLGQIVPGGGGYQVLGDYTYLDDTAYNGSVTVRLPDDTIVAYGLFWVQAVDSPISLFAREATPLLGSAPETMAYFADDNPLTSATEYGAQYQELSGGFSSLTVEQVVPGLYRVQGVPPTPPAQDPRPAIDILKDNALVQAKPEPKGKDEEKPAPYILSRELRTIFKKMDLNNNGKLTLDEIKTATNDPEIKGKAAAALVVLYGNFEKLGLLLTSGKWSSVTLKDLDTYDKLLSKGGGWAEKLDKMEDRVTEVHARFRLVQRGKWELNHVPKNGYKADLITQGDAGDCAFVATMISLVMQRNRPTGKLKIPNIYIRSGPQGFEGYGVEFGNGVSVNVPPPTDAQLGMYGKAGEEGLWFAIIERAYVRHFTAESIWWFHKDWSDEYASVDLPRFFLGPAGVSPTDTIPLLTGGHGVTTLNVKKTNASAGATVDKLKAALKRGAVVVGGTSSYDKDDQRPTPGHAYAIYRKEDDTLWAINPHRNPNNPTFGNAFPLDTDLIKENFAAFFIEEVPAKK